MQIQLIKGDITQLDTDAIVNAANRSLLGGGGVDGAIHRAAGPGLLEECRNLMGCETGEAKITGGYHLTARHVIHTVGPVWNGGNKNERQLLEDCYRNCLELADLKELRSLAFPNISTGVYGFPKAEAAKIAIKTVKDYKPLAKKLQLVIFAVFDDENLGLYKDLLNDSI